MEWTCFGSERFQNPWRHWIPRKRLVNLHWQQEQISYQTSLQPPWYPIWSWYLIPWLNHLENLCDSLPPNPTNERSWSWRYFHHSCHCLIYLWKLHKPSKPAKAAAPKEQIGKFPVFHDLLLFFQRSPIDDTLIKVFLDEWIQHHNRCCWDNDGCIFHHISLNTEVRSYLPCCLRLQHLITN